MATIFEHYDVDTDTRIYLDSMTRTGYFPMHDGTREVRYDDLSTAVNNMAYALRKFRSADEVADDLESIVNYFNDESGNMYVQFEDDEPVFVYLDPEDEED